MTKIGWKSGELYGIIKCNIQNGVVCLSFTWIESLLYGLISGLTDILPVSSQAHKTIYLKLIGQNSEPGILRFMIHLAILCALFSANSRQLIRMRRHVKLSQIPKRRRRHPLDVNCLMDVSLLKTAMIPLVFGLMISFGTPKWNNSLPVCAVLLLVNGVILFLPNVLRSGNKDSRSMTPLDGIVIGTGCAAGLLPGISSVGAAASLSMLRGADRTYAMNMALILQIGVTIGLMVLDVLAIVSGGAGAFTPGIFLKYLVACVAAFMGTFGAIRLVRTVAEYAGFQWFACYSLGASLFAFILYLYV